MLKVFKSKTITIGVVATFLCLLTGGYFLLVNKDRLSHNRDKDTAVCNDEMQMMKASVAIRDSDIGGVREIYKNIQNKEGYRNDISCMWIALRYSAMIQNQSEVEGSFSRIKELRENGSKPSDILADILLSDDSVRDVIKIIETNQYEFANHADSSEKASDDGV